MEVDLIFQSEDGGNIRVKNVGTHLQYYKC
jgi:hypothetical protein